MTEFEKISKLIEENTKKRIAQFEAMSEEEKQEIRQKYLDIQMDIENNWLGMLPSGAATCTDEIYD